MQLVNDTGNSPSPGQPTPGVVKRDKSLRGSVDTTKTRSGPQRVRRSSGDRPIGAAKGKQSDVEALCQPPAPLSPTSHWNHADTRTDLDQRTVTQKAWHWTRAVLGCLYVQPL